MTWQLFSPDLPFLNQIKVSQEKTGLWENILPYAPLASAFFAALSIYFAFRIASKAQSISEESKKIAEGKFYLDLFDKRYDVIISYNNIHLESNRTLLEKEKTREYLMDFQGKFLYFPAFFDIEDHKILQDATESIIKCFHFRADNLDKKQFTEEKKKEFSELYDNSSKLINKVRGLLNKYSSSAMKKIPTENSSTNTPASNLIPQPTGLKAIHMRLKRAACEWNRPLQ